MVELGCDNDWLWYLLWCLQPGPLEDKVSVLERRRTVQGIVGQVIVRVEDTQLRGGQHVLVPGLEIFSVLSSVLDTGCPTFLYTGSCRTSYRVSPDTSGNTVSSFIILAKYFGSLNLIFIDKQREVFKTKTL